MGKKPVAAVAPRRPELEQEVAVSEGIMGMDRKLKGGIMGTDRKLKDPEQEEKGGIPAAAISKGLFPQGWVGSPLTRVPEDRVSRARCGMRAIGSPLLP